MRFSTLAAVSIAALGFSNACFAQQGETVKIAYIDPLTGGFANIGQNGLRSWQFLAERLGGSKNAAGVKFEVTAFDNKAAPQDSINALRAAIDQGFRYIAQGDGSGAALALEDAVAKHNERNPGKEILYINYAAVDPSMTNEKCEYSHFRFDADTSIKMEALTTFMKDKPEVKKVYLLNQNYSHGQQVIKYFKEAIARKRPDVQIVGEDLHPISQVKDFAPYALKIKQSGADTIVTGNWGNDLTLFVKSLNEAGLKLPLYTYYASSTDAPTALAAIGDVEVYVINYSHSTPSGELGDLSNDFKKKYNDDLYATSIYTSLKMVTDAMASAKSTDPMKVAKALENRSFKSFAGDVVMRASDHQLQQAMFINKWQKTDKEYSYNVENTGFTFAPVKKIEADAASTPTTCQMKRPG